VKWLIDLTVWGRESIPPTELRFRGLTRFVLPVTDISVVVWAVVMVSTANLPVISHQVGHSFSVWWACSVAATSFVAFVGVCIPKLWGFELVGRIVYVALIAGFLATRVNLTNPEMVASTVLSATLLWLPGWRVSDLGFVWWSRRHRGGA